MKARAAALWLGWLLWAGAALALDPEKALHQYRLDVWQPEQGLPWGSVGPILQTSDGYLWIGGYEGLARFDGARFKVFDKATTPALGDNNVYALAETADGSLWIGTDGGGIVRFAEGVFTGYTTRHGLVHDRVTDLEESLDGSLWVATRGGLSRFRDGRIDSWLPGEGLPRQRIWKLQEGHDGSLWIGTDGGLFRLQDGTFTRQSLEDWCSDCGVSALHRDREGSLWTGTYGGHLLRFEDGAAAAHWSLPGTDVTAIRDDAEGNLWIATYGGGLFRLHLDPLAPLRGDGGEIDSLDVRDGLTSDTVWELEEDAEGSLWMGTEGGGLLRLRDTAVAPVTTRDGLPHDRVWVIHADREGRLWAGTDGGLAKWENGELATYTTREGLASDTVTAFHERPDGSLWIGTYEGLNLWREGRLTSPLPAGNVPISAIYEDVTSAAVPADAQGDLWLGTDGRGLLRVRAGGVTSFSIADGLPANAVKVLSGDRHGTLWIGADGGLASLRDGEPKTLTQIEGLAGTFVRSLYFDPQETLWIGTRGNGLFRLRDSELTHYTTESGLYSDVVYQILEDARGNLWMSCNQGIFRVSKQQLDELARGAIANLHSTVYATAAGMKSVECQGESQPAGTRSGDGKLWFPTAKGLAVIDPENLKRNLRPPPVHVERILYDGAPVDLPASGSVDLPPGRRELEVDYTALSLVDAERIRFRYRLAGYDDAWVDAGGRRSAYYTNLAPGRYRFQVIASNNDGVWNETGATVELHLRPAFYETWPFRAICLVAAGFLVWGLLRFRVRRLERHNADLRRMHRRLEAKNAEVEAKNTEVEAKNAELQRFTYAVSHDLKSPLITIQGFLGFLEKDAASGDAERVAKDIGKIRGAAAKMQRLLDELLKLSRIGSVTNTGETFAMAEVAGEALEMVEGRIVERGVQVVIAPDLPVVFGDRSRLLRALQNLLENAVKYMGEQSEPRVEIGTIREAGEAPTLYVRDNGMGIAPGDQDRVFDLFAQLDSNAGGTGMGLTLVKRIIEVHGGRIWVESEGKGKGSTFFFTLPGEVAGQPAVA